MELINYTSTFLDTTLWNLALLTAVAITHLFTGTEPLPWPTVATPGGCKRKKFVVNAKAGPIQGGKLSNVYMILIILGDILFLLLMSLLKPRKVYQFGANHEIKVVCSKINKF